MTAGDRLVALAGPGAAGTLLASIGAGTTASSRLVAFSGLASATAAVHLLHEAAGDWLVRARRRDRR